MASIAGLHGKSVQFDPAFLPKDVTPEEVLDDLVANGVSAIHYMVVSNWDGSISSEINAELIRLLRNNGIAVWLMIPACGFFSSDIINDQKNWLMAFQNKSTLPSGMQFYSFHNKDFVRWQQDKLARILSYYPGLFSGIEFMESYFPEYKSLISEGGDGFYGDVSEYARTLFSLHYLNEAKARSMNEIIAQPSLYEKWVTFRVDAVTDFLYTMKKTIKCLDASVKFSVWTMGMQDSPDMINEARTYFGLDIGRIVNVVRPDSIIIQTSSQDWGRPFLNPGYASSYLPIRDAIKSLDPDMPVGVQADFVSLAYNHPGGVKLELNWLIGFWNETLSAGFDYATAYNYAVSKRMGTWRIPLQSYYVATEKTYTYQSANFTSPKIAVPFDPQVFTVTETQEGGWMKIATAAAYKWFNPYPIKIISAQAPVYERPSFSSKKLQTLSVSTSLHILQIHGKWFRTQVKGINGWIYSGEQFTANTSLKSYLAPSITSETGPDWEAQTFSVIDQRPGGWLKINTGSKYSWIHPYSVIALQDPVPMYQGADFNSDKCVPRIEPQDIPVLGMDSGFVYTCVDGNYGYVYKGEDVYLTSDLLPFDYPSTTANNYGQVFSSQTFHVIDKRGTWKKIRTSINYKWFK